MGRPPLDPRHGPMTPAERQRRRRAGLTQPGKPSYQILERRLFAMERRRAGPETMAMIERACGEAVETMHWLAQEAFSLCDENKTLERRVRELEAERGKLVARIVELEALLQARPNRLDRRPKGTRAKATKPR